MALNYQKGLSIPFVSAGDPIADSFEADSGLEEGAARTYLLGMVDQLFGFGPWAIHYNEKREHLMVVECSAVDVHFEA